MYEFTGKVAFVTGLARGQGRSHANELARAGANIIGIDICEKIESTSYEGATEADLAETVKMVESHGVKIRTAKVDVRDYDALKAAVDAGVDAFGGLDFVLANAGIFAAGRAWDIPIADWREMIDINLTGVWHAVRATVPHLINRGSGAIVITGSIDAVKATPNASSYAAAKHGTVGLMKSLANELGEYKIRVNSVNPTQVDTKMIQNEGVYRLFRPDLEVPTRDDVVDSFASTNVLPVPWVEPRDISRAIMWLLSDEARYVTGTAVNVDAGYTIK
jgi:SDR family mycofactocin-dependent oxidoreductase